MNDLQANAIRVLRSLRTAKAKYDRLNDFVSKTINDDFAPVFTSCDARLETEVVKLLDAILGDEIASYWLYECTRNFEGKIIKDGTEYQIRTIEDVIAYVDAMNKGSA